VSSLILILFGDFALRLFGAEFSVGYPALAILLCGQLIHAFCGPTGHMMAMTGLQDIYAKVITYSLFLNLGLNLVLIPKIGMLGAAIASAVSLASWNLALAVYVYSKTRFNTTAFALPIMKDIDP